MKRLFLCSSFADVANLFVDCAKEDLQGKIIAFIPTGYNGKDANGKEDAGINRQA